MSNDSESIEEFLIGFADFCRTKGHSDTKQLTDKAESLLEAEGMGVHMLDAGVPVEVSLDEFAEAVFRYNTNISMQQKLWYRLLIVHTNTYYENRSSYGSYLDMIKKYFPYGIPDAPAKKVMDATPPRMWGNKTVERLRRGTSPHSYFK